MKLTCLAVLFFPIPLFLSCTACSLPFGEEGAPSEVTILSWNVQNLFDDVSDGSEYDDFDPVESGWNSSLFYGRLERVEEVFSSVFDEYPHIVLLQEVENLNTLNILAESYLHNRYPWTILIEEEGVSVHTAVLSSFPVLSVAKHETGFWGQYPLRPVTEIRIDLGEEELVLFNNHWKSRSGGVAATEEGRLSSALVLTERIKKLVARNPDTLIVAAGDFNENPDEYKKIGRTYRTAIIPIIEDVPDEWSHSLFTCSDGIDSAVAGNKLSLYSPWYDINSAGTYVYKSQWSKIDNFFLWKSLFDGSGYEYSSFDVIKEDILLNEYNYPARWDSYTNEGYSDHLPILLRIHQNDI